MKDGRTRLPENWTLPEDWAAWTANERPDLDVTQIAEEFKDYWLNRKDKLAWKISWLKTWRNWVKGQKSNGRPLSQQPRTEKLPDRRKWEQTKEASKKHREALRRAIR